MVEFDDCGLMAQMSYPTMELPIQLAQTNPDRLDCGLKPLDFEQLSTLHFQPLQREAFPCYDLALRSAELGDNYPCAMNGAGEIAVHAFLAESIPFTGIADVIAYALERTQRQSVDGFQTLSETDGAARAYAREFIAKRSK